MHAPHASGPVRSRSPARLRPGPRPNHSTAELVPVPVPVPVPVRRGATLRSCGPELSRKGACDAASPAVRKFGRP